MKKLAASLICFLCANMLYAQICFDPDTNYQVGAHPYSLVSGDFNKDGYPDIATANVAIYVNSPS